MNLKKNIVLFVAIISMLLMLLFIVFGENGLTDLYRLKRRRDGLVKKTEALTKKNLSFYHEIERLKNDPKYVENVARQELGVIGKDEMIIKVKKRKR